MIKVRERGGGREREKGKKEGKGYESKQQSKEQTVKQKKRRKVRGNQIRLFMVKLCLMKQFMGLLNGVLCVEKIKNVWELSWKPDISFFDLIELCFH